jgi:hypothetical protein
MTTASAGVRARPVRSWPGALGTALPSLAPGLFVVALDVMWAIHNGGFDADTWYWGALASLAMLTIVAVVRLGGSRRIPGPLKVALVAFAAYVTWSYLSISWAQAKGAALQGSNRALLYLIMFTLMTLIPWRARTATIALVVFVLGLGGTAVVVLLRLASADSVAGLFTVGRLAAPTGYFNSNAALFTICALVGTALACRAELPAFIRGLLAGSATAGLQLSVMAQSRGWLFTLPLILLLAVLIVPDRARFVLTAIPPAAATAISAHKLVAIFNDHTSGALNAGARSIGHEAVILIVAVVVLVTVIAWADTLIPRRRRVPRAVRIGGSLLLAVAVISAGAVGVSKATHNDPVGFVKRQWDGFSHPIQRFGQGSYFATVGSGRYDFWRVALDAFTAHPIGGLGQDNFEDFYLTHRHTREEPLWTHSLELRLLVHTGAVGFALFAIFIGAAIAAIFRSRRRRGPPLTRIAAAAALLPAVSWLVHGSLDWFWEIPAMTGPALGFLAMGGTLSAEPLDQAEIAPTDKAARRRAAQGRAVARSRSRHSAGHGWAGASPLARVLFVLPALVVVVVATLVLTLPYLSVREVSLAGDTGLANPAGALRDYQRAADLNPLNPDAGTRAGLLALSAGEPMIAKQRFTQAIDREAGSWLPWLGRGLAQSALGELQQARQSLRRAYAINRIQPPITVALKRLFTRHPLTYAEAVPLFVIAQ